MNTLRDTWRNYRLFSASILIAIVASMTLGIYSIRTVNAAAKEQFPAVINLPDGFFPEGIAVGKGSTFYVGSLSDGSIFKGDLRTGAGAVLTAPTGSFTTVGLEVDNLERIWVAGGPSGTGRVYDGVTGDLLAEYTFTNPFESFLNDVLVTNTAAYFTDSGTANNPDPTMFRFAGEPRLFVVPLGGNKALPDQSEVSTLATNLPDIDFPNLNGIETTPGGASLVVGHSTAQALYTLNPDTGDGEKIDIDGTPLIANDGIIRRGTIIYVVQNTGQASAVKIAPDGSTGNITAVYPVAGAETPTTAGLFGDALYVADARFNSMAGPYKVFRVDLH